MNTDNKSQTVVNNNTKYSTVAGPLIAMFLSVLSGNTIPWVVVHTILSWWYVGWAIGRSITGGEFLDIATPVLQQLLNS